MPTFARWVATPENQSTRRAVGRVADGICSGRPRRESNPLFLHGPAGTGKTHLVAALAHELAGRRPELTVQLVAARDLAGRDAKSLDWQSNTPDECDFLAIEDVQHLPGRAAEALVQLIDCRLAHRQQTVITATQGPAQLTHLPARLTSRLVGGLVVGLTPLGPQSRLIFLTDRAARRQLAVGREVLAWLAQHLMGSVRRLEGAVARLETLVRLYDRIPDLATVQEQFRDEIEATRPTVQRIAERVGRHFRVDPRLLQSRRRSRGALEPRQIAMYLARRLTPLSLEQIGAYFGGRDHSTVLHACRKVEQDSDLVVSGVVRQLQAEFA
jgi:chromosomal replication initiator protein